MRFSRHFVPLAALAAYLLCPFPSSAATVNVTTEAELDAALQVAKINGGTVRVAKDITLTKTITVENGREIVLEPVKGVTPTLRWTADTPGLVFYRVDDLTVRNLRLIGVKTDPTFRGAGTALTVLSSNRALVADLHIDNWSGHGINLAGFDTKRGNLPQGVWDSSVLRCTTNHCNTGVFLFNDSRRVLVQDCFINGARGPGIYVDDSHRKDGTELARPPQDCVVDRCVIVDSWQTGINLAAALRCQITRNIVRYCGFSSKENAGGITIITGLGGLEAQDNLIQDNVLDSNRHNGVFLYAARRTTIRGNQFLNCGWQTPYKSGQPSIRIQSYGNAFSADTVVEGNTFRAPDPRASVQYHVMIFDNNCTGTVLRRNTYTDARLQPVYDNGTGTITE